MELFSVARDRCLQDSHCLAACPRDLLTLDEAGFPVLAQEKEARCTRCGHCAAVCPTCALQIGVAEGESSEPIRQEDRVRFAQARQLLRSCRSVRNFRQQAVARQDIEELLQVARLAPSGGNNQMVRWVVVEGKESMRRMSDLVAQWFDTDARANPKYAARYAIDNILARYRGGEDVILRGAPNAVLAYTSNKASWGPVDSAIALTYFNLAAHAQGLGCCWGGYLTRAAEVSAPLKEFLGLEADQTVQGALVFGQPDLDYLAVPVRNPVQVRWL